MKNRIFCFVASLMLISSFPFIASAQNCTANAGLDQTICVGQTLTLTGTAGSPQSSPAAYLWTKISGPAATITSATNATTTVTGFSAGNYVFQFSNKCADDYFATNLVSVTVLPEPATALAGDDVTNCTNTPVVLNANAVTTGYTGTWTSSGGGTFSPNATTPNATFTPPNANAVTYTLTWTISNGSCVSTDTKLVRVVGAPTVNAGAHQVLSCKSSYTNMAASSPGLTPPQTGLWSLYSGPNTPVFASPASNTTQVSNLIPGIYILRWTVSGSCLSAWDTMTVVVNDINVAPDPGTAQTYTTFCGTPATTSQVLSGSALAANETALWTQTAGGTTATFVPNATGSSVTVTNMTGSFPYTFRYTKTNASGCTANVTHTVYRNPGITNLSEPPNMTLACDAQSTSFNMTYDDAANITQGITRSGLRISGPAATGTLSAGTGTVSGGTRTDPWTVSNLTTAGTYIFRIEYRNSCGSVYRDIAFTVSRTPGVVNAGSNPILPCNTLNANPIGSATTPMNLNWSQISGPNTATLSGANTLSLLMSGLDQGVYQMRLTNSGGAACPAAASDVFVKVTKAVPTLASAGTNSTICAGTYRLNGNVPAPLETGVWTVSPSTGVTFSPNANTPNAYARGLLPNTTYTFTWTVSNSCGSINSSQVNTTTASLAPPIPDAGADVCRPVGSTTASLSGSAPGSATVLWRALTAGSTVSSPSSQNTTANITGGSGVYLFEYALSASGCSTFTDTVAVTVNNTIATPNAGTDQDLCVASVPASTTLTATPAAPAGSVATWSQLSGPSSVTLGSPSSTSTSVTGMVAGIYEFEYRIRTGSCAELSDVVVVRVGQQPSDAVAGPNQSICSATTSTNVTLAATAPAVGTGYWQVISGPAGSGTASFSNSTAANTTVNNLSQGTYLLRWTTQNGPVCPAKTSDMTIDVTVAASAGAAVTLCDKTTVNLTGNANTTGTWSLVSGSPAPTITTNSANTAIVTGLTSTATGNNYTFRYTLPVIGSCPASTSDVVVTNYAIPTTADAGPDRELCFNTSNITITGVAPAAGYGSWARITGPGSVTGGSANGTSNDTTVNGLSAGLHIFEYRVQPNSGCVVAAATDRMQVIREVTSNAGTAQRVCNATSVTLSGNAPIFNTGTWSYVSGPTGSAISNTSSPTTTVTGLVPGTYVFAWTITAPGCTANSSTVQVIVDPAVSAASAGPDQSFCEGSTAAFQIGSASQAGVTYAWSPATLLSSTSVAQPNFTGVNNAGTFTYTVRAYIGACEVFDAVTITVKPKPNAVVSIGSGVCNNLFSATDIGTGVAGPVSYTWNFGSPADVTASATTGPGPIGASYKTAGSKPVNLAVSSADGCSNSAVYSYTVTPGCVLPIVIESFTGTWSDGFVKLSLKVSGAVGFDHFEFERSYDAITFSRIGNISYTEGTDRYSYNDHNLDGSKSIIYYRVKLVDADGRYSYSGVRQVLISQSKNIVAPNPFTDKIGVWMKAGRTMERFTLRLFDNMGQLVMQQQTSVTAGDQYLQLNGLGKLASGFYTLQIITGNNVETHKLVKK